MAGLGTKNRPGRSTHEAKESTMDTIIIVAVLVLVAVVIVRYYWRAIRGKGGGCSCQSQGGASKSCCQNSDFCEINSTDKENDRQ